MSGTIKTDQEINLIITDYKRGMDVLDIAKKHNHSKSGIYVILKKYNIPRRYYVRRINKFKSSNRIVADYLRGLTYRQITKRYNISEPDIGIILKATGTPKRGRPKRKRVASLTFEDIRGKK